MSNTPVSGDIIPRPEVEVPQHVVDHHWNQLMLAWCVSGKPAVLGALKRERAKGNLLAGDLFVRVDMTARPYFVQPPKPAPRRRRFI